MSPTSPRPDGSDHLRDAMDRVRGTHRDAAPSPSTPDREAASELQQPALTRRFWDIRGKVLDDLARVPTPGATTWPRQVAGLVAGVWAAAMSWLLVAGAELVAWVFAPLALGSFGDLMRAASATWLLADGGVVHWQGAVLSLPPLLGTLLIVLFQRRAAGWLVNAVDARDARSAAAPFAFAIASSASVQALVAATISNDTVTVPMWRSIAGAVLVAATGFGWGISHSIDIGFPAPLRAPVRAAGRFIAALLAIATVAVLVLSVAQRSAFAAVLGAIAGDVTSRAEVLAVCLLFLPTALVWALAVLVGPGFSVGAGTAVTVQGTILGALPPVPLLAIIPETSSPMARLLLLLPAIVALWAARPVSRNWRDALAASGLAAIAGAVFGLAASGGIGPGRLAFIGTTWWQLAVFCAGWMLIASGGWSAVRWLRVRIADAPPEDAGAPGKLGA